MDAEVPQSRPGGCQDCETADHNRDTESALKNTPKSIIRPALGHPPTTRNLMKTDPVARYFQYKVEWAKYPVPEGKWRELRSEIRTESTLKTTPKSFIRPALGHPPTTKNRTKIDPVARYFQYKVEWAKYPVPEGKWRELRSEIRTESTLKNTPKSIIRPALGHPPTTRNRTKIDPVARYFQHKVESAKYPVPGGKRSELRSEIRELLAYQPPPARTHLVHRPNDYIVPTDKKRSALRWEIKHNLLPP